MDEILLTAHQSGALLSIEMEQLSEDAAQFLNHPKDQKNISKMKNHALKLNQKMREL